MTVYNILIKKFRFLSIGPICLATTIATIHAITMEEAMLLLLLEVHRWVRGASGTKYIHVVEPKPKPAMAI